MDSTSQGDTPVPSDGATTACTPAPVAAGPLAHIPLFAHLDSAEQNALLAIMRTERFDAHQTVFWCGDRGDSFYLVSRGRVAITAPSERGEHVLLNEMGPGGFFGEISLLDGGPRTATVRTTEPTELFVLSRAAFHAFLRQRPDAAIDVLAVMGQRQRASTQALREMKNPNVAFEQLRIGLWQRASDVIAATAASKWFTLFHLAWFSAWIAVNLLAQGRLLPRGLGFDPFPFGLLTMIVSLEAIFLSIFVMVSQNRQAEKDRLRIDLDYQVNVKAQTEIMSLGPRLDRIEALLQEKPAEGPPA